MKRKLVRSAIAIAITGSIAISASAQADIVISEYVEGSSYNKAVEIANTGDAAVTLTGYQLSKSTNGNSEWGSNLDLKDITLEANSVIVIYNSRAGIELTNKGDIPSSVMSHNGNDPIALRLNGVVVDIVGNMGGADFAKDVTLVRSTLTPSATYNEGQWTSLAKDTFSGLGSLDTVEPPAAFTCLTPENETPDFTSINAIQGEGDRSPLLSSGFTTEEDYYVTGVVSARVESLYKGFYLAALDADDNDNTSDGLFISTGSAPNADIQPGAVVCVKGKVSEFYSETQLKSDNTLYVVTDTQEAPEATELEVDDEETLAQALERHEGMLIRLTDESDLQVTRNFGFDYDSYRNNMVLSYQQPLIKPTQKYRPLSPEAKQLALDNAASQMFIETDYKPANGVIPYFPEFDAAQGYIRIGDRVENLEGVVGYSYSRYRLVATNQLAPADFVHLNDRTIEPEVFDGSNLKVASFNVLNFFTSASAIGGELNASCKDQADADASRGCNRGTKDLNEFLLQRTKIVNALVAMNADIVGLMEIENNGFESNGAAQNLLDELNSQLSDSADHYQLIKIATEDMNQGQFLGSDAITVALIYRPSKVKPKGSAGVIRMPEQHITGTDPEGVEKTLNKYQRDSLMQTFKVKAKGKGKKKLTIVVNHLKSKGSSCYEDWITGNDKSEPADLQGHCNAFRVSASVALSDALKNKKGDVLVLGDLNAYGMEDPVRVLTDYDPITEERKIMSASGTSIAGVPMHEVGVEVGPGLGLKNLNTEFHGTDTYSYSYEGELGNLDHALGNKSLAKKMVGIEDWHINAVENSLFEYSGKYSGDLVKSEGPYSASDHDPVVISLKYGKSKPSFSLTIKNNSNLPLYPVFNTWYWDTTKPWMFAHDERTYDEKDNFLQYIGIGAGDKVKLSVLALGVFNVPCSHSPLKLKGEMTAIYNGRFCRIK